MFEPNNLSPAELGFIRWKIRREVIGAWRPTRGDWKYFKGYTYLWEFGLRHIVRLNEKVLELMFGLEGRYKLQMRHFTKSQRFRPRNGRGIPRATPTTPSSAPMRTRSPIPGCRFLRSVSPSSVKAGSPSFSRRQQRRQGRRRGKSVNKLGGPQPPGGSDGLLPRGTRL